eukprot:scaffold326076_cov53-Tisochrysis_lutea.AAC.1
MNERGEVRDKARQQPETADRKRFPGAQRGSPSRGRAAGQDVVPLVPRVAQTAAALHHDAAGRGD